MRPHLVAGLGIGASGSNVYYLSYPAFAILAAVLAKRLEKDAVQIEKTVAQQRFDRL